MADKIIPYLTILSARQKENLSKRIEVLLNTSQDSPIDMPDDLQDAVNVIYSTFKKIAN